MEPNTAVLLIAHGSRESRANDELREVAMRLENSFAGVTKVYPCFLEIESPSIPEAFDAAAKAGAKSIIAFPFFLSSGVHVLNDIPTILQECQRKYSEISIAITPSLGPDDRLDEIILDRISEAGENLKPASETPLP